jgi:drug/metabolite transporter (DMT)-like permease
MSDNINGNVCGSIMLFVAAFIWGTAFVAQSVGMDYVGPFTFNMARSVLGGTVLLPVIAVMQHYRKKHAAAENKPLEPENKRTLAIGGISCGVILCTASLLQQTGMQYTTVGKAGFITALYIVLVPVFSIFLHKKAGLKLWVSVLIAVVGLYLLCMTEKMTIEKGDFLVMICAIVFSFHILTVDYFSPKVDGVKMSCIQFWVSALISGVLTAIFEQPDWSMILQAWLPIFYAGCMSSGVAYTFQILGQKDMNPTVASLIMSLESVIATLSGWLLLKQNMSIRETAGCILMFIAIILAQLPDRKNNKL